jgi:hypothetical protein
MGRRGVDTPLTDRVAYDDGIAWRISVEMPLGGAGDELREPLARLADATFSKRPPPELLAEAERSARDAWEAGLGEWTRETLARMRDEYADRLGYLADAIADIDAHDARSAIAPHAALRVAEHITLHAQLDLDFLDDLEDDLSRGALDAHAAVREVAIGAGRRLDVPSDEVLLALRRVTRDVMRPPRNPERDLHRMVRELETPARRAQTRAWAREFAEETSGRVPLLAAAVAGAAEEPLDGDPAVDELWVGATRGLLLQHEAWRADGPHGNDLHAVLGPF